MPDMGVFCGVGSIAGPVNFVIVQKLLSRLGANPGKEIL